MSLEVFTPDQKPHLADRIDALGQRLWPRFLLHGDAENWGRLLDAVADRRILICNPDETLAAAGHSVPLVRNGTLPDLPETIGITKKVGLQ